MDDEAHMIWGCPALIDQRVQHSELFEDSTITSVSDFLQQDDVPRWWDADLAHGRRAARHAARRDPKSPAACALRQQYQQLLRRTQRRWTRSQAIALTELARSTNSKKFWQKLKPAKKRSCPIADDVMLDSFRKLLDAPTVSSSDAGTSGSGAAPPFANGSELNSPFTAGAVQQAIPFLRVCHDHCAELEGYGSSQV